MNIGITPKLYTLALFLWQVYRHRSDVESGDTKGIFALPAAEAWFLGVEENLFQDSYKQLDDSDNCWFLFLLLDIKKTCESGIEDVVYKVSINGYTVIIDDDELNAASEDMFGLGEGYELQEEPQVKELLAAKGWQRFNFLDYVEELIAEAKD